MSGFFKAVRDEVKPMLKKYLEPVKAQVVEVSGSTARVTFPGEDPATPARPFYPVIGATPTVGQTVLVLANFAGGWIITSGGSGSGAVDSVNGKTGTVVLGAADVGAAPSSHVGAGGTAHADATTSAAGFMAGADKDLLTRNVVRVFSSNEDYTTDQPFNSVAGSFVAMPYPNIAVPALGTPPTGTAWRIDVVGQIRLLPPNQNAPNLHHVVFSTGANSGIAGGKDWLANTQGMSPVVAYAMIADTLTAGFTISFTMWSNVSATWNVRTGRNPVARVYLVSA